MAGSDAGSSSGAALPAVPVTRAAAVSELANGVVAAARRMDRGDLAAAVQRTADRWAEMRPRIALTGTTGVGRRTVVAALAGRTVIGDVSAGTVVEVVFGEADCVTELAVGAPSTDAEFPVDLRGDLVQVEVAAPTVPPLTLVLPPAVDALGVGDPRGTGGIDAVVHVASAARPLTDREVELLAALTARTRQLILAVTHTDLHHRWHEQATASQELLHRDLAPHTRVTTVGLAPPLALDPTLPADESGVPALLDLLEEHVVDRVRALRLEAIAIACGAALAELEVGAAGDAAQSTEAQLAEAEQQLTALRTRGAAAVTALSDGCAMLREGVTVELQRHVRDALDADLDDEQFAAALEQARLEVVSWAHEQLQELIDAMAHDVGELLTEVTGPRPTDPFDLGTEDDTTTGPPAGRRWRQGRHLQLRLGMAFAQLGTASMFAMRGFQEGTTAGLAQGGVFLLAGLLGSVTTVGGSRQAARKEHDRTLAAQRRRFADDWRARTQTNVRGWLLASQRELERDARDVLQSRRISLESHIRELRRGERRPAAVEELAELEAKLTAVLGQEDST